MGDKLVGLRVLDIAIGLFMLDRTPWPAMDGEESDGPRGLRVHVSSRHIKMLPPPPPPLPSPEI